MDGLSPYDRRSTVFGRSSKQEGGKRGPHGGLPRPYECEQARFPSSAQEQEPIDGNAGGKVLRRAAATKARTFSGSFRPGSDSTPLAVSTEPIPVSRMALATLSGVRPPARAIGMPSDPARVSSSQLTVAPVPPSWPDGVPRASPASTTTISGALPQARAASIHRRAAAKPFHPA